MNKSFYLNFLLPNQLIDNWLVKNIGSQTVFVLNNVNPKDVYRSIVKNEDFAIAGRNYFRVHALISKNFKNIISISYNCDALELMVLYVSFLFCFPSRFIKKLYYIALGLPLIHLLNVGRCIGLVVIADRAPRWLDFTHHYLFTAIIYLIIFLLWVKFTNKNTGKI